MTSRLERWAFPWLGRTPVADLTATDILDVLRRIEAHGAIETAHRIRGYCSQILMMQRWADYLDGLRYDKGEAFGATAA